MRKSNTKSNTYRNMLGRVIPKNYMVHIQFIFKNKTHLTCRKQC